MIRSVCPYFSRDFFRLLGWVDLHCRALRLFFVIVRLIVPLNSALDDGVYGLAFRRIPDLPARVAVLGPFHAIPTERCVVLLDRRPRQSTCWHLFTSFFKMFLLSCDQAIFP